MLVEITNPQLKYLHFLEASETRNEPEYVNQSGAFRRFGRSNVERWTASGIVKRYYRPKTVEYNLNELRRAAVKRQDYEIE
jgi:hypothetical protein